MAHSISRRRAITVLAAAAGLPLMFKGASANARMVTWEGTTLGAPSTIQLYAHDEAQAHAAIEAGLAELNRLENIFSLYRADSTISVLNREGRVDNAPAEFIELLQASLKVSAITDGIHDPTVQPVWMLYLNHFTAASVDPNGPSRQQIDAALSLVDWKSVEIDQVRRSVAFRKPGMALTLNSGGQGYITDRVGGILLDHGFDRMLVDMGEQRAYSAKPDGSSWRLGLANPADQSKAVAEIDVVDKAVATSGGYGTLFDEAGRFTHIINPKTGETAPRLLGVSVVAPSATVADCLAASLILVPEEKRQAVLAASGAESAIFVTPDGVVGKFEV